jgi:hypothetical protein
MQITSSPDVGNYLGLPMVDPAAPVMGLPSTAFSNYTNQKMLPTAVDPANNTAWPSPRNRSFTHDRIYNPDSSPAAITTENALAARALMAPQFMHNIARTKMAQISNMFRDMPNFGRALNVLA